MKEPFTPRDATLETAGTADREAALRMLGIEASHARRLVDAARRGEVDLEGLWSVYRGNRLVGAAWGQLAPGRTAFCWTPVLCAGESTDTVSRLQAAVDEYLDRQHVDLIQASTPTHRQEDAQRLIDAGYQYLATLLYLACNRDQFPQQAPVTDGMFEIVDASQRARWETLIARTYADTLDCKHLENLRALSDVIDGYRATGVHRAPWWLVLRHEQTDVGCLLLADHPEHHQVELLYVGLVPTARGRGWGLQMTQYAQWLVAQAQRDRMILAVDAQNWPALRMYVQCGFYAWDQRCVYVRTPARQR